MADNNLLEVKNLRVTFKIDKHTTFEAVKGVSFNVPYNSSVALVGESGSGKSVSALSILGLLPPETAKILPGSEILFNGKNLVGASMETMQDLRGKDICMIFQEPMTSLNPVFTVGEQIAEVLRLHLKMNNAEAKKRAVELMSEVGIPSPELRVNSYPHELSGGQQQRVMIAIAIACEPKLLIADEPTTALDVTIQKQILDLLAKLQQKHKMSLLFITHDLALVGEIADHVVVMRNGEVQEADTTQNIFEHAQNPYTKALLECRPHIDKRPLRLPVVSDFMNKNNELPIEQPERKRGVAASDPIILEVKNLSKNFSLKTGLFSRREVPAVKNVSFKLAKGKTLGLVGESGSGKTTIGLTIMRLLTANGGEVIFDGKNILAMSPEEFMQYRRRIQIIFQNPYASLNPRFTIGQILTEPMQIHGIGANDSERLDMAVALLKRVSLPETSLAKYPHEFSGGQRQRIAIARCLTLKPDIIVCDESVSALDVSVQAQVLNLLQDLQDEFHMSYIFISHDLSVVKYISDQVMVLSNGELVELADSDTIYRSPQHPYTQKLLGAIPKGWQRKAA
ncbi:MAG: ABC transporter ATP-binding protein [Burkholderiales bacterium]